MSGSPGRGTSTGDERASATFPASTPPSEPPLRGELTARQLATMIRERGVTRTRCRNTGRDFIYELTIPATAQRSRVRAWARSADLQDAMTTAFARLDAEYAVAVAQARGAT